jgi:hypothetical protein
MAAPVIGRLALFAAAGLAAAAPLLPDIRSASPSAPAWPTQFEGRPLRRLAPAPLDARLARDFPGHIARFEDGRRQVVLRSLAAATRQLHPAKDCFGTIGYHIRPLPMVRLPGGALSSCFEATRDGGPQGVRASHRQRRHELPGHFELVLAGAARPVGGAVAGGDDGRAHRLTRGSFRENPCTRCATIS